MVSDAVICLYFQVCQISVQPPVNGELILRFQQLQSRIATLKIENEEVKWGQEKWKSQSGCLCCRGFSCVKHVSVLLSA